MQSSISNHQLAIIIHQSVLALGPSERIERSSMPLQHGGRGEGDGEGASLAGGAFDFDSAAHGVDQAFADGQAQTGSLVAVALGIAQLEELVENVADVLG